MRLLRGKSVRRLLLLLVLGGGTAVGIWYRWQGSPERLLAQGQVALAERRWDEVQRYCERLERGGHWDHARLLRAEWLWERGEAATALLLARQVQGEGVVKLKAALLAGKCLLALEKRDEAYEVFSWVVQQDPGQVDAYRGLAALAYDLGQWQHGEQWLRRVIELDPEDARPYRLLGMMYKDVSRWEEAETAYRQAITRQTHPRLRSEYILELAELLLKAGNYPEAQAVLAELGGRPQENSLRSKAAELWAEVLYGMGDLEKAKAELESVPRQEWTARMWRCRGQLYQQAEQWSQGVACLQQAVKLDRADTQSWYVLSQLYRQLGQTEAASEAERQVHQIHNSMHRLTDLTHQAIHRPWDAAIREELAALHEQLGQDQLARMWRHAAEVCRRVMERTAHPPEEHQSGEQVQR